VYGFSELIYLLLSLGGEHLGRRSAKLFASCLSFKPLEKAGKRFYYFQGVQNELNDVSLFFSIAPGVESSFKLLRISKKRMATIFLIKIQQEYPWTKLTKHMFFSLHAAFQSQKEITL
jgi:hypothetical protein